MMLPHQFERLQEILRILGPAASRLPGRAPEFVADQVKRVDQWGENTRFSPKQIEWLENLYAQETGTTMRIMVDGDRSDVIDDEPDDDSEDPSNFRR